MTVVAAFSAYGIPVLVGDLLITADTSKEESSFLPTSPAAASTLSKDVRAKISGTRKKVHLFGTSLAVAWSGSLLAASSVLKALKELSDREQIDKDTLVDFLRSQTGWEEDKFTIFLTGWVVKPEVLCFRWNSAWPQEVFFGDRFFDGSGDEVFEALVNEPVSSSIGPRIESNREQAIYSVLAKVGKLISHEVLTGETLRSRFGYCYEVAYFDGENFRYVDEVTYLSWLVRISNSDPRYQAIPSPAIVKYKNFGEYSAVQTVRLDAGSDIHTFFEVVTPAYSATPELDPAKIGPLPTNSNLFCNILQINAPTFNGVAALVNAESDKSFMTFEIRNGKHCFEINMRVVERMLGLDSTSDIPK
jgi:hypothetical protein